jgi:AmmeMemoRadiSam system protein A
MSFTLSEKEKQILLFNARETISAHLSNKKPNYKDGTPNLDEKCGAFVTIHKSGKLRGCIGMMVGEAPIIETIKDMAYSSAFRDPRFPPLMRQELKETEIEISVLTPLEKIKDPKEIEVGTHGIYIIQGYHSGVLLPQVATEQNWDRDTFLTHTCYKAGLPGEAWRSKDIEIFRFSAIIFSE